MLSPYDLYVQYILNGLYAMYFNKMDYFANTSCLSTYCQELKKFKRLCIDGKLEINNYTYIDQMFLLFFQFTVGCCTGCFFLERADFENF